MAILFSVLFVAVYVFILFMWARLILEFVVNLNRGWRPRGFGLVLAEIVYTVTDPPIKLVRRFVPPVQFGAVSLDLSWTVVLLVAILLTYVFSGLIA